MVRCLGSRRCADPQGLDVWSPDGIVHHLHGDWAGWTPDGAALTVRLSDPFVDLLGAHYEAGDIISVRPLCRLWRPATGEQVYRPRHYYTSLFTEDRSFLDRHPEWDTDCAVLPLADGVH